MPVDFNNTIAPSCAQAVDQLSASRKQVVQIHFDDKFVETALVQDIVAGLLQIVRFYVC